MTPARHALVRRPGPRLTEGLVREPQAHAVDLDRAASQWEAYVEVLRGDGWTIVEVEPADDCPDAVFVEDAVVVFDRLAVITRPGAPSRRGETGGVESAVAALGLETVSIQAPATLDGGDVLKVGRTVYVGLSERTNAAAIDQLRALLAPGGWNVVPVDVEGVLHLKSAVTALPDGTVIGLGEHVDVERFASFMAVPEPAGAHVVLLGDRKVMIATGAPMTSELLAARGFDTVDVDISEFEKLDGCVTCLSVRVRG